MEDKEYCCNDFKVIQWKKLSGIDKAIKKLEGIIQPLDGYYFVDGVGSTIGNRLNFCPYCSKKIDYSIQK